MLCGTLTGRLWIRKTGENAHDHSSQYSRGTLGGLLMVIFLAVIFRLTLTSCLVEMAKAQVEFR